MPQDWGDSKESYDMKIWGTIEEAIRHPTIGLDWSDEEIHKQKIRWLSYTKWKEQQTKNEIQVALRALEMKDGTNKTHMITLSFQQDVNLLPEDQVVPLLERCVTIISDTEYACLVNAKARFEFYSDKGWNPHIHIYTEQAYNKKGDPYKASAVAQTLWRKLKDSSGIKECYRTHGVMRQGTIHSDYIHGIKSDEKQESVDKDKLFREKYGALEIYEI